MFHILTVMLILVMYSIYRKIDINTNIDITYFLVEELPEELPTY